MIRYISIIIYAFILVFIQMFILDLIEINIELIILTYLFLVLKDVKRQERQYFLFFSLLFIELLNFEIIGILTFFILMIEILFDYVKNTYQNVFSMIAEIYVYLLVYLYFFQKLYLEFIILNSFLICVIFLVYYLKKYGLTKISRR